MENQINPQQTKKTQSSKIILVVVISVIAITLIVGGGIYLWQNSKLKSAKNNLQLKQNEPSSVTADKEGWSSYQSQKWNFQFQYPSNYVLDTTYENKYADQGHLHLYDTPIYEAIKKGEIIEGAPLIEFSAYNNPDKLSALQWAKKDTARSNFSEEYKTTQVDNRDAMSYSWTGLGGGDTILLTSDDLEYIYSFHVLYMNENEKIRNDFLQIVKTIKF
ncbi:MAG: hypothetical protein WC650_02045 [Candidatus Doudnabacteria bacterium]